MKWKLVPTEVTHEMTSGVVLPGYDRTMAVRVFQSIVDHSPKASDDEELVEMVALQLQQWDWSNNTVASVDRARAILRMMDG